MRIKSISKLVKIIVDRLFGKYINNEPYTKLIFYKSSESVSPEDYDRFLMASHFKHISKLASFKNIINYSMCYITDVEWWYNVNSIDELLDKKHQYQILVRDI